MPADFSEYVDLRIFDKEPGDIYRDAIEIARLSLPEFNLRTGTPEDAIFQAMAYISALNVAAINRLPDRLMSGLVSILGFQRQEAVPAEIDVEITVASYDGALLPPGTTFVHRTIFQDEVQDYAFQLTDLLVIDAVDLEITQDYPSASATVRCLQGGIIPPISASTQFEVISSGTGIQSVIVRSPSNFANGINADTDEEYLAKATTYLRSLNSSLTRAAQIDAYLLNAYPEFVNRVKTYDLTNGDSTSGDIGINRVSDISNTFLLDDLATIETDAPHLFVVGDVVEVSITGNAASAIFNGEHEITATGESIFSFALVDSNSASTAVTGTVETGLEATGYATIFVYGLNRYLTSGEKSQLLADVRSRSIAGLTFDILDPTFVTLNVSGSVVVNELFNVDDVELAVTNALVDYLSPNSFPFGNDRIRKNQLISLISSIPGVVYVDELTLTPTGTNWLPKLGDDVLFRKKGTLPSITSGNIDIGYTVLDL
jgi:hypothetical protein